MKLPQLPIRDYISPKYRLVFLAVKPPQKTKRYFSDKYLLFRIKYITDKKKQSPSLLIGFLICVNCCLFLPSSGKGRAILVITSAVGSIKLLLMQFLARVSPHLTVIFHPTPGPAPQGAGRKRIPGIFVPHSGTKIPKLRFLPLPGGKGAGGMGEFERPRLNVAIPWPAGGPKTAN
jgi:hypothetical protein